MGKRRRLNREIVIAKGAEMADAAGSATAVSLTELAQALDVRPPSLYNHINGLEDLQQAMTLYSVRLLRDTLQQASLGLVGREALFAIATAYRRFALTHPGIYPLTIRAPEPDDTALLTLSQELIQMLRLIMASVGVQGDEAVHAIRGLRAILHGFTSLETAKGYELPLDRDESFTRLITTYLDGLIK